jgi:uncharacterized membrane protein YdbT with pleckstrin-like domain
LFTVTTSSDKLLLEARPSWWRFFWYFVFCWLIIPLIVAIWQKHALVMRVYDTRISLEKGILSKSYTEIFIKDIRTVQVNQGPFARMCGIGDINIATAGTLGYELIARGLPEPINIRDLIIAQGREYLV